MSAVVSLDGYIAHEDDSVEPLFDGCGNGDVEWAFTEDEQYPFHTTLDTRRAGLTARCLVQQQLLCDRN